MNIWKISLIILSTFLKMLHWLYLRCSEVNWDFPDSQEQRFYIKLWLRHVWKCVYFKNSLGSNFPGGIIKSVQLSACKDKHVHKIQYVYVFVVLNKCM